MAGGGDRARKDREIGSRWEGGGGGSCRRTDKELDVCAGVHVGGQGVVAAAIGVCLEAAEECWW